MNTNKKLLIALGLGWFVLFDILLSTSNASLNAFSIITGTFRGLLQSILFARIFVPQFSYILLALIGWLALLLIILILRIWSGAITITRNLVVFLLRNGGETNSSEENDLLLALFGKDPLLSKNTLVWKLLRDFILTWILLLVFQLFASIISAMYSF
jgi:hypothetical protein